jgi:hypothetical protein
MAIERTLSIIKPDGVEKGVAGQVIDRIERVMTIYFDDSGKPGERKIAENELYKTNLLPGFELPLARLLAAADKWK